MSTTHSVTRKPLPAHMAEPLAPEHNTPEDVGTKESRFRTGAAGGSATRWAMSDRFDRVLPPHRRYLGRSRRVLLIAVGIIFLLLLAVVIGLAVGLSKKSNDQNLPLPNGAKTYTGELTYYGTGMGACGIVSTDQDAIVSISHYTFDAMQTGSDPNKNPACGKKIRAQRVKEGKTVSIDVTVVDRCTGCEPTDLDVSPAMFSKMANPDLGRVDATWSWL